jgi:hypothetical protein
MKRKKVHEALVGFPLLDFDNRRHGKLLRAGNAVVYRGAA